MPNLTAQAHFGWRFPRTMAIVSSTLLGGLSTFLFLMAQHFPNKPRVSGRTVCPSALLCHIDNCFQGPCAENGPRFDAGQVWHRATLFS